VTRHTTGLSIEPETLKVTLRSKNYYKNFLETVLVGIENRRAMATRNRPEYYVDESFRDHILEPISIAEQVVEADRDEVTAERDAFQQFKNRLIDIDTGGTSSMRPGAMSATRPLWRGDGDSGSEDQGERVRRAFRETVMCVDHYDHVYDQSLTEYASTELHPGVAADLRQDSPTSLDAVSMRNLWLCVDQAIEKRKGLCDQLDRERSSLETCRIALRELLATCDGPSVPDWYWETFESRLDDIAKDRQETLHRRIRLSPADGHSLCRYLYQGRDWTYPVLTAATRLASSVSERSE
jgi:hypothetical protein